MNKKLLDKLIETSFELIGCPSTINKHISFLVLRNTVLSVGFSQLKTSTLAHKNGYQWGTLHSELDCIRKSPLHFSLLYRCFLVNTRVNTKGQVCQSKPCKLCLNLLNYANFRDVFYTNKNGNWEKL